MSTKGLEEATEVAKIKRGPQSKAQIGKTSGKPRKVNAASMRSKVAFGGGSGGSFGSTGIGGGTSMGQGSNMYSPELSTDFLELPQSLDESRNFYRFFYQKDPFVGRAIDTAVEVPMSKLRMGMPRVKHMKNRPVALMAQEFCEKWAKRVNLLEKLLYIAHDYHLIGEVFVFCEDKSPDMPDHITHDTIRVMDGDGNVTEEKTKREDADERAIRWLKKNYKGWTDIRVLPPEQVHMQSWPLSGEKLFEFIPDSMTKDVIAQASAGDEDAARIVESFSPAVVQAVMEGKNVKLNTNPDAGSFVHYLANKKSQYEPRGHSILERCMRVLVYRDKLRQAQSSIASRHMTPMRLIWAEDASVGDIEDLREQVDLALQDPDYSIITNFQVNWEEMGSDQRLLDLSGEYDMTDRQLYAGLGVTESLLSGESSYSNDRINLEVINTRYMLFREIMQEFVERRLFEPMCRRMGYIEEIEDEFGDIEEEVLVPSLSFTRLALMDNQEAFDAMFNLYQKGSLDIDIILELLNIDPVSTREKLLRDKWTMNDPNFNEVLRTIYGDAGRALVEDSDVTAKIAEELGLKYTKKEEGDNRFG